MLGDNPVESMQYLTQPFLSRDAGDLLQWIEAIIVDYHPHVPVYCTTVAIISSL